MDDAPTLEIGLDKVCAAIAKARVFDASVERDPSDYDEEEVEPGTAAINLADYAGDPAYDELREFLTALNADEIVNLIALTWLGRDDYGPEDWADVLAEAREQATTHGVDYLLGVPLLGDHLENALSTLDMSCEDVEAERP